MGAARGPSNCCATCRARRIKCDGVRPVCGRCLKGHRQCVGFGASNRLIIEDETQAVMQRFGKKPGLSPESANLSASTSGAQSPLSTAEIDNISRGSISDASSVGNDNHPRKYQDFNDSQEFHNQEALSFPQVPQNQLTPIYEQNQVALYCCRETVNLRTLSWIMADEKWVDLLPEMMSRSNALTSVIYANAATYLAKMSGATSTPKTALNHYINALRELQQDLYDPVRQTSDETLFSIILLGLHNTQSLGSWQAHVRGATKLIECNGSDYYKPYNSPARVLAKYVRGFDILRAMSNQEYTVFGQPEWDHLAEGTFVRPLDSLLTLYARITNAIERGEKVDPPSVETFNTLVTELTALKDELAEWRKNLPPYYEPIPVPIFNSDDPVEKFDFMELYPYTERYDYMTSFVGHTMNMYRAGIMNIDRHLLSHMYPMKGPSESEVTLGKEVVMSMPSLTTGGIFLLYPAMRAAKVMSRADKVYIMTVLRKIAYDVPVASALADHILDFEFEPPTPEQCKRQMTKVWDIQDGYDSFGI